MPFQKIVFFFFTNYPECKLTTLEVTTFVVVLLLQQFQSVVAREGRVAFVALMCGVLSPLLFNPHMKGLGEVIC